MSLTFALMTPSFAPDFERCRLLAQSVRAHVADHVHHYIIVDTRDERLFSELRSPRTHIVVKQDIIPRWLVQVPFAPKWWASLKGAPVRGWIVQQITKLSVNRVCSADVYQFVDSDTFFVRPYDPRNDVRGEQVPLFREVMPRDDVALNTDWHNVSASLLGFDLGGRKATTNYVTQLVTWRQKNLTSLLKAIETRSGKSWAESICRLRTVSEYVLYGTYCEHVLKEASGHYYDPTLYTLNYWETAPLGDEALRKLRASARPDQVGVMISAKSNTPIPAIRRAFDLP